MSALRVPIVPQLKTPCGMPYNPERAEECSGGECYECGGCQEHCACEDGFVECECENMSGDIADARYCRAHGPHSASYRRMLEREAEEEMRFQREIVLPLTGWGAE